jgi:hypothetical protein
LCSLEKGGTVEDAEFSKAPLEEARGYRGTIRSPSLEKRLYQGIAKDELPGSSQRKRLLFGERTNLEEAEEASPSNS